MAEAALAKAKWLEAEAAAAAEAAAGTKDGQEDGKKNLKIKLN